MQKTSKVPVQVTPQSPSLTHISPDFLTYVLLGQTEFLYTCSFPR